MKKKATEAQNEQKSERQEISLKICTWHSDASNHPGAGV